MQKIASHLRQSCRFGCLREIQEPLPLPYQRLPMLSRFVRTTHSVLK